MPKATGVIRTRTDPSLLNLIPESMARRFKAMPLSLVNDTLQVAMANPSDIFALEALGLQSRKRIEPVPATEKEVLEAVDMNYREASATYRRNCPGCRVHATEMDRAVPHRSRRRHTGGQRPAARYRRGS